MMKLTLWMSALLTVGFVLTTASCKVSTPSTTDAATLIKPSLSPADGAAPANSPQSVSPQPGATALASNTDITGVWNISEARGIDGTSYNGSVNIQPLGEVYRFTWDSSLGTYDGTGFLVDDQLFVGSGTDSGTYGVAIYRIQANGTLEGRWTLPSSEGRLGTETATKSNGDLAGTYQIEGTNPGNDGGYDGTLEVRQTGETYQLTWRVASDVYTGVGLRSGDWLAVSWGDSGGFGVMAFAIADNTMSGRWAVPDETQLGVENLVRE
ncbi:MAG: hypothetical protein SFY66_06285 [Oculatellaceae cyanobacterium bins.114]|nr:hypothetical protein [Oculatellaceae cyanobacterium bins.114]